MVAIQRSLDQSVSRVLRHLFALMGGAMLLAFAAWFVYGQFLLAQLNTVYADRVVPLRDLTSVGHTVNVVIPQRHAEGSYEGDGAAQALEADWQRIETLWSAYLLTYLTPREAELATAARRALDELRDHLKTQGVQRSLSPGQEGAVYSRHLRTLNERLNALNELQAEVALAHLEKARRITYWGVVIAALLVLSVVLLAVYANHLIRHRVIAPVQWVVNSLERMAEGDVAKQSSRLPLSAEFSELFDQMERVRHSVAERQHLLREEQLVSQRLRDTQMELVESEKLASLGSLVAGVAHELNTPIGIAVAVSSGLEEKRKTFAEALAGGALKRSALESFLGDVEQAGQLLRQNLARSAALVHSFKQVSVDRSSAQRRRFDLAQTVEDILMSLRPTLRGRGIALLNELPPGVWLDSYPGALGQVVINLINNAALHAFDANGEAQANAAVRLELLQQDSERVELRISDNGAGMPEAALARIFEPFFTTRLGQGGSGLGMSIVRNIVLGLLGGRIQVQSTLGAGTTVELFLPKAAPVRSSHTPQEDLIYAVR